MKKMSKKENKEIILIIFSFFAGLVVSYLLLSNAIINHKLEEDSSLNDAIEKVKDGVVTVEIRKIGGIDSTGTGFIYKTKGNKAYIITNEHVITNDYPTVINEKGVETEAKVLGKDANIDIAVLEIEKKYAPKVVKLGESKKSKIGDSIFIIGSPISQKYHGTVTTGIISGFDRDVPIKSDEELKLATKVIQFDAPVNPGNSGGPLVNEKGQVIGICLMKLIENEIEGMAFAIPIETATSHIEELEQGKEIKWPELGIAMVDINNITVLEQNDIKVPLDIQYGIVVLDIKENSNAENKLKKGDIITKIDDKEIKETIEVKYALMNHKKNDKIKLQVLRDGKEKSIEIILK